MRFTSFLLDHKIMGVNVGADLPIGEYLSFAVNVVEKNEYQRTRVRSAGKTYDLLRKDLVDGCIMPPIILAVTGTLEKSVTPVLDDIFKNGMQKETAEALGGLIREAAAKNELIILDGLQRTLTMISIANDRDLFSDQRLIENFLAHPIRVEIYIGLSKMGILYRMLTLNTGQTPMSFRHQLEILYHDYIDNRNLPDGIEIVRETDEKPARGSTRYKYQDVVDMFYAYSTGSPMPFDRHALVGELREMKFLEDYNYRRGSDEMRSILVAYHSYVNRVCQLAGDWHFEPELHPDVSRPFGSTAGTIFGRPQPMAGFGAECKRLIEFRLLDGVDELPSILERCAFSGDPAESLTRLVVILDEIASRAKKIGDAQRLLFQYSFRYLLTPTSDSYLDLGGSWLKAQENYEMMH